MTTDSTMTEIPLVERLLAPAFWCCESDEGHPGDATDLVHEAAAMLKAAVEALEEIATELVSDEAMRSCAINTLASLNQYK